MQLASADASMRLNEPIDDDSGREDGASGSESEEGPRSQRSAESAVDGSQSPIPSDKTLIAPVDDDLNDSDYLDEEDKKVREDEKIARMIQEAEDAAACPSEDNVRRAANAFKRSGGNRKSATLRLISRVGISASDIKSRIASLDRAYGVEHGKGIDPGQGFVKTDLEDSNAEARLSLSVSKADFERMRIVGQFNLGFVLAIRPATKVDDDDELFIIDQHAADEKYNYERLQRTVSIQSQRLVRPLPLDLTAVEEELILDFPTALQANGFEIETISSSSPDHDNDDQHARKFQLRTLPISGTKTFNLSDLEELLYLLSEASAHSNEIPRPIKVQRMLAMRACRSSIMVGKTLTHGQMQKVISHMGEMEKPWNCPHGRPTMRHLAGLGAWKGWQEGDAIGESEETNDERDSTTWKDWMQQKTV
nr:dna mismatch repair protein pms1 [Quercus suber]